MNSLKSLMFLTSALASAGLVIEPTVAAANGLSQLETWGMPQGGGKTFSNLRCDGTVTANNTQSQSQNQAQNQTTNSNFSSQNQSSGKNTATSNFVSNPANRPMGGNGAPGGAYGYFQPGGPPGAYGYARPVLPMTAAAEAGGQCHFVDTTVVKAIHAICVSADGHEFPASHMTPDSWINSGSEGEIARCLPGSVLKVMVGSVMMSDQGLAVSLNDAQVLNCGPAMAVRHFKDGMLKCAMAQKVPDSTERTNLRKWGTGDMFFSYVTRVCLELKREMGQSRASPDTGATMTQEQRALAAATAAARARELHL